MTTTTYYNAADNVLDGIITVVRRRGLLTTPEIANAALGALAQLDPEGHERDRRERLLAAVLATAVQRLIHRQDSDV